jgi:hypothetical protein
MNADGHRQDARSVFIWGCSVSSVPPWFVQSRFVSPSPQSASTPCVAAGE